MKMSRNKPFPGWQALILAVLSCTAFAANNAQQQKAQLQVDINNVGNDLSVLERNALLPASSRVEIFFSVDQGIEYTPQTLSVIMDGKPLTSHSYNKKDLRSLRVGGLQTLWQGTLPAGAHQLQVSFSGLDHRDKPVQNTAMLNFDKGANHRALEVKVTTDEEGKETVFTVKDWGDKE